MDNIYLPLDLVEVFQDMLKVQEIIVPPSVEKQDVREDEMLVIGMLEERVVLEVHSSTLPFAIVEEIS